MSEKIVKGANAPHFIKIEYCGGWGYRKYAIGAIEEIEKVLPGQFHYEIIADPQRSGRLEVTVYRGGAGEGELVHSKASSGKYIHQDQDTFLELVKQSIEWASAIRFPTKMIWIIWKSKEDEDAV